MFTKEELIRIDSRTPEDYDQKAKEFWDYAKSRISAVGGRLKKVYLESNGVPGKRQLEMLRISDPIGYEVVKMSLESGAELVEAESPELVLETVSWMQKLQEVLSGESDDADKASALQTIGSFLQESMGERDRHVAESIASSLKEGEVGVLFMDLSREINLPADIRVVVTCPFQPRDYLNSWLATLRLKGQTEASTSDKEGDKQES